MKVRIPFSFLTQQALRDGSKTWTSRNKRYGLRGDTFDYWGKTYEIVKVERRTLEDIAQNHFREEGFDSPEKFIEVWKALHKQKGYVPTQRVYVHVFKLLGDRRECPGTSMESQTRKLA